MPRFRSAEVIVAIIGPAILAFTTSAALWTPPVGAKSALTGTGLS